MTRRHSVLIILSAILLFIIILCPVLAFFGLEVFVFGVKFTSFIGFLAVAFLALTAVILISFINEKKETLPGWTTVLFKSLIIFFTVVFGFACLLISSFFSERILTRVISDDRRHEITVEEDETFGGYNVTLYKRSGPMLKTERRNFYIDDLAGDTDDISVVWYDDSCDISYMHYPDYSDSPEPVEITQRLFYSGEYIEYGEEI